MTKKRFYYTHEHKDDTEIIITIRSGLTVIEVDFKNPGSLPEIVSWATDEGADFKVVIHECVKEISDYLAGSREFAYDYGKYTSNALHAMRNSLEYVKDKIKFTNSSGNEIAVLTIKQAAGVIYESFSKCKHVRFDFADGDILPRDIEAYQTDEPDAIWYGVKRISCAELFDGFRSDMFIVCGEWGGGNVTSAYLPVEFKEFDGRYPDALINALCDACGGNPDTYILLETIPEEVN